MAKGYILQEKRYIETGFCRTESFSAALVALKKLIIEECDIKKELVAINDPSLPAPKYRESVYRYLAFFFYKSKYPSHEIIDYSDYEGEVRKFDPDEFYEFEEFEDATEFEKKLGFVFCAGEEGMRLGFLGSKLLTYCFFKKRSDNAAFGIEYLDARRQGLDARIYRSTEDLPPMLSGSFYAVLLLDILLKQEDKLKLVFSLEEELREEAKEIENNGDSKTCLKWEMERILYARMNEGFILPSKITLDENTICDHISLLKKLGYNVENDSKEYYIPPFICKKDVDLIHESLVRANIPDQQKIELSEKFKSEAGYHRFSKNDGEEFEAPLPLKSEPAWTAGAYALLIYNTLRFCARPLSLSSSSPNRESVQELVKKYYGVEIDRKKSIPNNIKSMIAMGLPVVSVGNKYSFDTSKLLLSEDIETLSLCIDANGRLSKDDKERLKRKLTYNFPIGDY